MNLDLIVQSLPQLLQAFLLTLELAATAIFASTVLGLIVAAMRTSRLPIVSQVARVYVEIFRGSPLPITLLFVYFGVGLYLGVNVDVFVAAAIGLSVYHGAYIAEIFRSGIDAVPVGQREASRVLGLTPAQTFRFVVLPQTTRIVFPPMVGQYLSLIKDTSIAFVIGLAELMKVGQGIVDRTGDPIPIYITITALYFVVCYPLSLWVRRNEKRIVPA